MQDSVLAGYCLQYAFLCVAYMYTCMHAYTHAASLLRVPRVIHSATDFVLHLMTNSAAMMENVDRTVSCLYNYIHGMYGVTCDDVN